MSVAKLDIVGGGLIAVELALERPAAVMGGSVEGALAMGYVLQEAVAAV